MLVHEMVHLYEVTERVSVTVWDMYFRPAGVHAGMRSTRPLIFTNLVDPLSAWSSRVQRSGAGQFYLPAGPLLHLHLISGAAGSGAGVFPGSL